MIARLNLGGPAQQAAILSGRRLDPERFETLLVHGRLAAGEESMADLAAEEGARTTFLPTLSPPVRPGDDVRALAALVRIVRRFRPHIVHTHTAKAGFLGRTAALLAARPRPIIAHTYHGHVLEDYFGPLKSRAYRQLESALARFTDRLVGVSQATVDDLVRLGVAERDRFRVIALGLDLSRYSRREESDRFDLRRKLGVGEDDVLAVYVGRLVPIKRLDVLIRAVAHAGAGGAPLRLALIGGGETRPDLEQLAGELGIADRVDFLGYRRDLPRIFAAADLAALSSDDEGTPVSLIEAAAAGLPAVATRVGGVAEVVASGAGLLVGRDDARAMAEALGRLAGDPPLRERMGVAARAHVLARYTADRLVADTERLYADLLSSREPSG